MRPWAPAGPSGSSVTWADFFATGFFVLMGLRVGQIWKKFKHMFENNLHVSVGGGMVFLSNKCSKNLPQGLTAAGVKTMSTYAVSTLIIPSGLNRRGRLARTLVVLSLAVVLLAGFAFTAGAGDVVTSSADSGSSSYVVLTVGSGDSIWSIARTVADGRDVRSVVDAIVTANSLSDGNVVAGQKIRVPLQAAK